MVSDATHPVGEKGTPQHAVEDALYGAEVDGFMRSAGRIDIARRVLTHIEAAGFRVLRTGHYSEDCDDPWVCCIHTPPKEADGG